MKFAAPYTNKCFIELDEYNIEFTKYSEFDTLIDFVSSHKDTRINIHFENDINIEKLILVNKISDNICVRLDPKDFVNIDTLKENNIKLLINNNFPINTYSLLYWVFSIKPESIYIADDLFYNLQNVHSQCSERNIEIRMILNRIPSVFPFTYFNKVAPIYRPQDFNLLNKFISIGEFDCYDENGNYDWTKCEAQYNKWFIQHYWEDDLRFINSDVKFQIICPCVPPELAEYRSSCKFACLSHGISHCNKCKRLYDFSNRNFESGVGYKIDTDTGLPPKEELFKLLEKKENEND